VSDASFFINERTGRIPLTMCQATNDDNGLKSSFFLVASIASLLRMTSTAVELSMSPLSVALMSIQDTRYRRQHTQPDPHFFLLLMSNELIFESPQCGDLAGGRGSTAKLRQYGGCGRACHV